MTTSHNFFDKGQFASHLYSYDYWIWDFDGVIKDSIKAKEDAFLSLFPEYSSEHLQSIKCHHRQNLGISRHIKIPFYYSLGHSDPISSANLDFLCNKFSDIVVDKVISSSYVPGFIDNILPLMSPERCYLVSATPQQEIELILAKLGLSTVFHSIYGGPNSKESIFASLKANLNPFNALYIGDSLSDYLAASVNSISFIFRKHEYNDFLDIPSTVNCIRSFE